MKTEDIILYPNCSEAVMRIKVDSLTDDEHKKIMAFLKRCNDKNNDETWKPRTKLDKEIDESWHDTGFNEKTIFGISVIEIDGDSPYNSGDWLEKVIRNIAPNAIIEVD